VRTLLIILAFCEFANAQTTDPVFDKVHVVVFILPECPISQKYISKLDAIYLEYKDRPEFSWTFIIPEKIKKQQIADFVKEHDIHFPVENNFRNRKHRKFNATVTPEVIVISNTVLYQGAIDNWYYDLGQYGQSTTEHYLIDALKSILKKQMPDKRSTRAIGCPISTD
jgi:hypothetical protein